MSGDHGKAGLGDRIKNRLHIGSTGNTSHASKTSPTGIPTSTSTAADTHGRSATAGAPLPTGTPPTYDTAKAVDRSPRSSAYGSSQANTTAPGVTDVGAVQHAPASHQGPPEARTYQTGPLQAGLTQQTQPNNNAGFSSGDPVNTHTSGSAAFTSPANNFSSSKDQQTPPVTTPRQELPSQSPRATGEGLGAVKPPVTDEGLHTRGLGGSSQGATPLTDSSPNAGLKQGNPQSGLGTDNQAAQYPDTTVGKVQQWSEPYVQKTKELGAAAANAAQPALQQVQEGAGQAYSAVTTELDRRGINSETSKQTLADLGQGLKDYSAVGQERATEYLQQAFDSAHAIGTEEGNKNILITVAGAVALVWLAFGFSFGALFALGVAAAIAAILSRLSRGNSKATGVSAPGRTSAAYNGSGTDTGRRVSQGVEARYPEGSQRIPPNPAGTGRGLGGGATPATGVAAGVATGHPASSHTDRGATPPGLGAAGIETHYPSGARGTHPDASANAYGQGLGGVRGGGLS